MNRSVLRQKDAERLMKAAKNSGMVVMIDLKTLVATVIPDIHRPKVVDLAVMPPGILSPGIPARRGKEYWDED